MIPALERDCGGATRSIFESSKERLCKIQDASSPGATRDELAAWAVHLQQQQQQQLFTMKLAKETPPPPTTAMTVMAGKGDIWIEGTDPDRSQSGSSSFRNQLFTW